MDRLENTRRGLLTSGGWRVCVGGSHLKCKDPDHRFMITDAVLHVACVQVLSDLQRVLLILVCLLGLPNIRTHPLFPLVVLRGVFGSQPPQNPVGPGRFPLLRADAVVKRDCCHRWDREQRRFRQQSSSKISQLVSASIKPIQYQIGHRKHRIC